VAQPRPSSQVSTIPIPPEQLRVIGHGRPLDDAIRRTMESFFQADFSGVRVHEGPAALAMGALAFTLGEELHFAPGLYDPESREGMELLGHELTHVVQQRDGRVANPYGQGIAIVQGPALEAEADRMGQEIADQLWSGLRAGQPAIQGVPVRSPVPMRVWAIQGKPDDRRILRSMPSPSMAVQRSSNTAFPPPDERGSLPWDAPDLTTTLNYLVDAIRAVAEASKNSVNKGKADIHFTSSIKKTSVVDTIFRCKQEAEYRGSEMTQSLAWYNPDGNQAGLNQYGPHITIRSPGQETSSNKTPDVYHHVYFKYGETREIKS